MRFPLGVDIESRDGTLTKDAKVVNGFTEQSGDEAYVYKRPGNTDIGLIRAGTAQLLVFWNGLKAVIGDYFCTTGSATSAVTAAASATWATATLPSSTSWAGVAYGNGIYLAVAATGAVATSPDGITWTARTSVTARSWRKPAFNGTVFCLIDQSTNSATSGDGITWNQTGVLPFTNTGGIASNGSIFVCTNGGSGTFRNTATSSNGITWTMYTNVLPSADTWLYIAWNGTVFCLSNSSANANVATSPDGVTWTARTKSVATASREMVAANGIIIIFHNTTAVVSTSSDNGATWTSSTLPFTQANPSGAYNGTYFLAVEYASNTGGLSADGITWTATTVSSGATKISAASNGAGFVVVNVNATTVNYTSAVAATITSVATNLSPSTAGSIFSAQDNGSNAGTAYLMIKNLTQAWSLTNASGATPTLITDVDYPGSYSVTLTSLTRSGTVATATTANDTNFQVGSSVTIAGATPVAYNGAQVITGITASSTGKIGPAIITITRSTTTATAVSSVAHGFANGDSITITGATQTQYNGVFTITWISATSFSFTVSTTGDAAPSSPATGSPVLYYSNDQNMRFTNTSGAPTVFRVLVGFSGGFPFKLTAGVTLTVITSWNLTYLPAGNYTVSNVSASGEEGDITSASGVYPPAPGGALFGKASVAVPTISSITSDGIKATVTTTAAHNLLVGIGVSGATQYQYNNPNYLGLYTVVTSPTTFTYPLNFSGGAPSTPITPATGTISATKITSVGSTFTFTIAGSPATPATGTITAGGGRSTVPGICYLNGYFTVVDIYGVLYNSDQDDPTIWNPLQYTAADSITGAAKAHAQTLNYILVFKEWSIEPFYDRQDANPIGSPFAKLENGLLQIGCASGTSLAKLDGSIFWMSQAREEGRAIHVMNGTAVEKVSTPAIDRVLKLDTLSGVYAWAMKINGHSFYILTLVNTNVTLVFDSTTKKWGQWTSVDDYFKYTYFANALGRYMTLHTSDGHLYEFSTGKYQDAGVTIATLFRTVRLDGGSTNLKAMSRATVIGDSVADTLSERHSDDDCSTWSALRTANLAYDRPMYRRLGSFTRRTMEFKHTGNVPIRLKAIEIEVE